MSESAGENSMSSIPWWIPAILTAMAGGLGWGIRGQYGHETGAMIPGLLVSLTLAFLLCPNGSRLAAARAIAWGTVAMGIGGTMTYGQTVGLTHDPPLIGNWEALRWGMLGLAIKGGLWIGFAGLFLGMGLGGVRYRPLEIFFLLLAMLGAAFIGIRILNEPFDPENQILPKIYFSDDWHWEPEGGFTPRREVWGGLLFSLVVGFAYAGWKRRDRLARNLGLWGILGGFIGFPGGQCVQAFHAWNRELFQEGFLKIISTGMNPWNMMETFFGFIMGAALGLGAWLNRGMIAPRDPGEKTPIPVGLEAALLAVHIPLLIAVDFVSIPVVDFLYDFGPCLTFIPLAAIAGGRWWPYLQIYTVTLIPIAGKTLRALAYHGETSHKTAAWFVYVIIPVAVATTIAFWMATRGNEKKDSLLFSRFSLLFCLWLYFGLNYAFFNFPLPWPWLEGGGRSHSGLIFLVFAVCLTVGALFLRKEPAVHPETDESLNSQTAE